jgi:LacI family transcriptional regulator
MAVTIYDIAKKLNLSHATVSMALRDLPQVNQKTREKIKKLAEEMGYSPNQTAVSLKTGHTKQIAFVLPHTFMSRMVGLLDTFRANIKKAGYQMILYDLPFDVQTQREIFAQIANANYTAVVTFLYNYQDVALYISKMLAKKCSIIVIGPPYDIEAHPGLFPIKVDNTAALEQSLRILIENGHRNIAHVIIGDEKAKAENFSHPTIERVLQENGIIDWDPAFYYNAHEPSEIKLGYNAAKKMVAERPEITAIQCINDVFSIGFLRGLQDCGVKVPDDISIIGSDNIEICEYSAVSLTTIDMRYEKIAVSAWEILQKQLQKPD